MWKSEKHNYRTFNRALDSKTHSADHIIPNEKLPSLCALRFESQAEYQVAWATMSRIKLPSRFTT